MPRTKQTKPRHITEDGNNKDAKLETAQSSSALSPNESPDREETDGNDSVSESEDKSHLFSQSYNFDDVTMQNHSDGLQLEDQDVGSVDAEDLSGKTGVVCDDLSSEQIAAARPQTTGLPQNNADNSEIISPSTINKQLTMWSHENGEQKQDYIRDQREINNPTNHCNESSQHLAGTTPLVTDSADVFQTKAASTPQPNRSPGHTSSSFADKLSSEYFNSIKNFVGNNATKFFESNSDVWQEWMKSYYPLIQTHANNSSLVNEYMKEILNSWNSLVQDRSNGSSLFYPSFHYGDNASKKSPLSNTSALNVPTSGTSQIKTENLSESSSLSLLHVSKQSHDSPTLSDPSAKTDDVKQELNCPTERVSPVVSTKSKEGRQLDEYQTALKRSSTLSPAHFTSSQQAISPARSASKYSNAYAFSSATSTLSSQAAGYDRNSQLLSNPYAAYSQWPTPWLGYHTPGLSAFTGQLPYPSFSTTSMISQELSKSFRKSSLHNEKNNVVEMVSSSSSNPVSLGEDSNAYLDTQSKSRKKRLEPPSANPKLSDQTNNLLEACKRRYNLPYMPYSPYWLGAGLSFNPALPSAYANVNSKKNSPKMFYPSDMMQFSAMANTSAVSPSGEPSSYSPNSPYKHGHRLPSSVRKLLGSRRSRTREPAFDSVHAAIVREAKEQSKGVDPENMYIQCPICQKRIKRLYHFQRHMRIHTGEKSHQCPCCQYKSVRKDNLKSHMKTHEKQNLEGGRKGGKATHQNSNVSGEKSRSGSSGSSSKSATPNVANDNSQNHGLNLTVQSTRQDILSRNSSSSSSVSQRSEPTSYHISENSNYNPLFKYESSPKQSPLVSQSYSDDTHAAFHGAKSKSEPIDHRQENVSFPGATQTQSRPNSEPITDIRNGSKKRDSVSATSLTGSSEAASKRRRLSRGSPISESDTAMNLTNINNNNDANKNENMCNTVTPFSLPFFVNQNFPSNLVAAKSESAGDSKRKSEHHNGAVTKEMVLSQKIQNRPKSEKSSETSPTTATSPNEQSKPLLAGSSFGSCNLATDEKCNQNEMNQTTSRDSFSTASFLYPNYNTLTSSNLPNFLSLPSGMNPTPTDVKFVNSSLQDFLSKKLHKSNNLLEESLSKTKSKDNQADMKTGKDKNVQDNSPNKLLQCRLCSFNSFSNLELQSHVSAKHKQNGFYKCEECTYLGKNLSKLVEHIRIHTGERPFKCDQCSYAAKRKDNLAQHKAVRHDKRKAKSGSHYPVIPDLKHDLAAACGSHLLQSAQQLEKNAFAAKKALGLRDHQLSPQMSLYSGFPCAKDQDAAGNPSSSRSLTPPLHSFASVHALPSLFQHPYYRFPTAINSPELGRDISAAVSKPINNTGTYSVKVRAALIAP